AESWSWTLDCWESVYRAAGVGAGDRIFFAFSFGMFLGFWTAFESAERLGVLRMPGGGMSSAARLRAMLETGATVLCCTPTYALRLAEVAAPAGGRRRPRGSRGGLTLTRLGGPGSPLLRYRTGDMVETSPDAVCTCGSDEMALLGGILGRTDDMIVVRGVNIFPVAVEDV